MPIVRGTEAPTFEVGGIRVVGLSAPSRGASEITLASVEFGPGSEIPPHTHDHEEVLVVISGRLRFTVGGDEALLEPGDAAMVPAGTIHRPATDPDERATIVSAMPAGTVRIDADGNASVPPWAR